MTTEIKREQMGMTPVSIIESGLSDFAVRLYAYCAKNEAGGAGGRAAKGMRWASKRLGCDHNKVKRGARELVAAGLIELLCDREPGSKGESGIRYASDSPAFKREADYLADSEHSSGAGSEVSPDQEAETVEGSSGSWCAHAPPSWCAHAPALAIGWCARGPA